MITTATLAGVDALPVQVSASREALLPSFLVVGYGAPASPAVKELRERVRSAIEGQGLGPFPRQRVVVEMAPADLPKRGAGFDLPVALAILGVKGVGAVGELSLHGDVRPVRGLMPILAAMKKAGVRKVLVPAGQAREAMMITGLNLWPVRNLADAVQAARSPGRVHSSFLPKPEACLPALQQPGVPANLAGLAKQVAAALRRGKSVLIRGGHGSGAALTVRYAMQYLPDLSAQASREVTAIFSAAGLSAPQSGCRIVRPPFRAPHHMASTAALVGSWQGPGEVTLAHRGVLLLDDVDEFARPALEALKAVRQAGRVAIHSASGSFVMPARFGLVGTLSPGGDARRAGFAGRWDVVLDASGGQAASA